MCLSPKKVDAQAEHLAELWKETELYEEPAFDMAFLALSGLVAAYFGATAIAKR